MAEADSNQPLLVVKDLHVKYGAVRALRGASLTVREGEVVALVGANGAGKTTLVKALSNLLPHDSGQVWFSGKETKSINAHRLAAAGLVHVPQGRAIFSRMTVMENLAVGAFGRSDQGVSEDLDGVFQRFPRLYERRTQLGGTLSGGEQQMLAIGRGLMARPRLLMMDEPSLGLSPLIVREMFDIIRELSQKGITVLLVEQNARQALRVSSRGYVLVNGKVVLQDDAEALLKKEDIVRAYLGRHQAS